MKNPRLSWLGLIVLCAPAASTADSTASAEALLENKQRVVQHMALNPAVVRAVRQQNADPASPEVRKEYESEWGSEGVYTPLKRALEGSAAGQFLKAHVERDPVMIQATLTDAEGDTVALFPAQGPYFHGDADAWRDAYNNGKGKVITLGPTDDDGDGKATLTIAAPVIEQGKAIGVLVVAASLDSAAAGR